MKTSYLPIWFVVTGYLGIIATGATGLVSGNIFGAELDSLSAAAMSITKGEAQQHVDTLANDTFEGREAGTSGGRAAGGYLLQHVARCNLLPQGNDGGYFQPFGEGYRNILGLLEGSDTELKHEIIIVGAHYDHVGYGTGRNSFGPVGYIHNGADDNASGTAGLLELMQAFGEENIHPRRSILFALWDAEEKGMLGSKHWVEHPTVPLERVVFTMNLDMIGRLRNDELLVLGSRTQRGLRGLVSQENLDPNLKLNFIWENKNNSDHWPFYTRQIPFCSLHTGLHDDYHRPSDDAQLINGDGIRRVTQLAFRVIYRLANRQEPFEFRDASKLETPLVRQQVEHGEPQLLSRLGVMWSIEQEQETLAPGLKISQVESGSPAEQAGLRGGDRIIQFNGEKLASGEQLRTVVVSAPTQSTLRVARDGLSQEGDEKIVSVPVHLRGSPVRIGISWREDDAEPGVVILSRIIPGSPADLSGLQLGDRVHKVVGHQFSDGREFGTLMRSITVDVELVCERMGQMKTVHLALPSHPEKSREPLPAGPSEQPLQQHPSREELPLKGGRESDHLLEYNYNQSSAKQIKSERVAVTHRMDS